MKSRTPEPEPKGARPACLSLFVVSACVAVACVACAALAALSACAAPGAFEAQSREPAGGPDSPKTTAAPAPPPSAEAPPPLSPEEEAINRRLLRLPLAGPKVVVAKKARRVTLYSKGERVRVYRAVLGFAPEGDKERQGDGRTPEGTFYVCVKNEKSNFYLSLGLSYPDAEDAERGLRAGLVTPAQAARIRRAARRRATPPWDTALGGEIFIHGGGVASDWTAGCVALENEQMRELFDAVPVGAVVVVEP